MRIKVGESIGYGCDAEEYGASIAFFYGIWRGESLDKAPSLHQRRQLSFRFIKERATIAPSGRKRTFPYDDIVRRIWRMMRDRSVMRA